MPETPILQPFSTSGKRSASPWLRLPSLALSLLLLWGVVVLAAKERPRYALIFGSVFDDQGFALRKARIVVTALNPEKLGAAARDKHRWEGVSDARGEFAIRVPAGKGSYSVAVEASGYSAEPKTVEIKDEERVDLLFRMKRGERKK